MLQTTETCDAHSHFGKSGYGAAMGYPDIESGMLEEWQEITNLIAGLCHVPVALVMRQNAQTLEIMSSSQNTDSPYKAFDIAPLNGESYCETVIRTQSPLHIANALNDPNRDYNVDTEPEMISYYGVPVNWPDGTPFGSICILDRVEKSATDEEKAVVKRFGRVIETTLELIASNHALEQSRKRHFNLYEYSHDMIFILDPAQGEIVAVNPKVEEVLGYRADELTGSPMIDLNPDEAPELMALFSDVMQKGHGQTDTLTCLARFGEKHFVDISAFLIEEDGKELAIAVVRDITRSRQAEKDIRASEEKFQSLVESTSDWIWEVDANGVYTYASPRIKDLLGYEPDEVVGKTPFDLMTEGDKKRIGRLFGAIIQARKPFSGIENINLHKDGHEVILETSGTPIFDKQGTLIGYRGIDRDITERKKIEEQLYSNMRLQSKITQNIAEGIFLVRAEDGVIVYANRKFEMMFGYEAGELDGKPVSILNAPTDTAAEEVSAKVGRILHRDGQWDGELRNIRKDGSTFWSYVSVSTFQHPEYGAVWLGAQRDITGQRQSQEALKTSEAHLHAFVSNMPGVAFLKDIEGRHLLVNKEGEKVFGKDQSEVIGKTVFELFPDDVASAMAANDRNIIISKQSASIEEHVRMDGRDMIYQSIKFPIIGDDGKVVGSGGIALDITESKRTEEQSLALTRIFEGSLNEIYIFDAKTLKFIMVNHGARINLGYEMDELKNQTPVNIKPEFTRESFLELLEPLMTGKEEQLTFTTIHQRKNGSIYPVEVRVQLSTLQFQEVFVAFILDITDRKEAEVALQKSEEKYRQLIEGLKEEYFFYAHGVDGVFTYISPSIQNVLGYQPEEYLVHYHDTFTDNPINRTAMEKSEAGIQGKQQPTYELEVRRKDNSVCRLAVTEFPILNEADEVIAVEGIAHDITEHRLAEEALELTRARHDEAQRIAQLGHWTLDLTSNELLWSDENYRVFGVEPGAANTYETFLETVHPDDREFVNCAYSESVRNRTPYNIEHRLLMNDGSIKWVHERCETEYADDGSPLRSMGTTQDITERRQLQDTLYFTAQRGWNLESEDFFQALTIHIAENLQADFVVIGKLLNPERVKTVALYARGKTGDNIEYDLAHTPCEQVIGNNLCYYPQGIQQLFPRDNMLVEMGAESYLAIPLWDSKGKPLGLIAVIDSKPITNEFRAKSLLRAVSIRVAAELERRDSDEALERSREQLRALVEHVQAVRENEQKRIARDIHDDLGQLLTAINIDVSAIEELLPEEQKDLRTKAQGVSALISAAISKVQKISSTLRPTLLDDLGITAAVEWQVREFQNRTGIHTKCTSTLGGVNLSDNLATEIYRIFQEALTNVARHAGATEVTVDLRDDNGKIILEVRDNGRGITEEEINDFRSIGLLGIHERAYSLHGDVVIQGKPGKGSSLIVTFPTGDEG